MQSTTSTPVTNVTTALNTTTKSREQILTQSSGAMIAVIVIGIIIILTILLLILKTYNRRTHAARVMGTRSKPRQKSSSTVQTSLPMQDVSSVSSSFTQSNGGARNGVRLPRVGQSSVMMTRLDQQSSASSSTVATIHHETLPMDNTT